MRVYVYYKIYKERERVFWLEKRNNSNLLLYFKSNYKRKKIKLKLKYRNVIVAILNLPYKWHNNK